MGSLYGILAVVAAIGGGFSLYQYTGSNNKMWLVIGIIGIVAFIGLGGMFLAGRVNKTEDIHITE